MIRTLIVEDDFRVADVHSGFVERLPDFSVVGIARTGEEAERLADELEPDLVLLDMYLPDRSGLEVLRHLRGKDRAPVGVIVITAAKDVETLRAALEGGVTHYLVKPFAFSVFRDKLEAYAALHARLAGAGEVSQNDVDRIVGLIRPEPRPELPKGLSPITLEMVTSVVRGAATGFSATQIAESTGVSRVTSRRYLAYLVTTGAVVVSMRYGSSGRPEHRYRWAAER